MAEDRTGVRVGLFAQTRDQDDRRDAFATVALGELLDHAHHRGRLLFIGDTADLEDGVGVLPALLHLDAQLLGLRGHSFVFPRRAFDQTLRQRREVVDLVVAGLEDGQLFERVDHRLRCFRRTGLCNDRGGRRRAGAATGGVGIGHNLIRFLNLTTGQHRAAHVLGLQARFSQKRILFVLKTKKIR